MKRKCIQCAQTFNPRHSGESICDLCWNDTLPPSMRSELLNIAVNPIGREVKIIKEKDKDDK